MSTHDVEDLETFRARARDFVRGNLRLIYVIHHVASMNRKNLPMKYDRIITRHRIIIIVNQSRVKFPLVKLLSTNRASSFH
jgi:hypothetical protein